MTDIEKYQRLCGSLYQFVGAHSLEDEELLPWLNALSDATKGKPPSEATSTKLLPYTLPQDRPRTNHDHKVCRCYGCILERDTSLTAERDTASADLAARMTEIHNLEGALAYKERIIQEGIAEVNGLRKRLTALEWQEITPENMPKVGDEVWWNGYGHADCAGAEIITQTSGHNFNTVYKWIKGGYTHFRPINAPVQKSHPTRQGEPHELDGTTNQS